ncbi:hypothetical protein MHYP_G00212300 [Metynnis hypsauchen]
MIFVGEHSAELSHISRYFDRRTQTVGAVKPLDHYVTSNPELGVWYFLPDGDIDWSVYSKKKRQRRCIL